MSPTPSPHERPRPVYSGDEIELRQLARAVWLYRSGIVVVVVIGLLAGSAWSWLSGRYASQGLFLTPQTTLSDYKRYAVALASEPRLMQFIETAKLTGTQTSELLHKLVERPEQMAAAVRPVFQVSAKDAKDFGLKPDESGGLVGIELSLERYTKEGEAPVKALAEYIRSTAINVDLHDKILGQCLDYQTRERKLRNEQIQSNFDIRQQQDRAAHLRELIASTPGVAAVDNRQLVSIEHGGERFLSPSAQLVAVEVLISDLQVADAKRERDRIAAGLRKEYYCRALVALDRPLNGPGYLDELGKIREDVFKDQDMSLDIAEQTSNEMELERLDWVSRYLQQMRFVVSPDGSERKFRKPPITLGLLLGGVLGLLLGLLYALARAWWHDNAEMVAAPDE